jgi:hypothetical protein
VTLPVVVALAALIAAEAAFRLIDGYRLTRLTLQPEATSVKVAADASAKWQHETDAWPYVRDLPVAPGVDREWFKTIPARRDWRADPDLVARAGQYGGDLRANYEWNRNYIVGAVCRNTPPGLADDLRRFKEIYVFDSGDGSDVPMYRFLRHATYQSGLTTNGFGWRGPDIPFRKPARTVRLAFVGASTTIGMHGEPYSYPELVGLWLNKWAQAHRLAVKFDVINAGREGINSRSIQAIVRQEVAPADPDLVLYYEGANQFWPANYISTPLPERSRVSGPQPGFLTMHSAIARRVDNIFRRTSVPGTEPRKPVLVVNWPPDLDEREPDLAHASLPLELPAILHDLDAIRSTLDVQGAHLALASFVWLVYAGMVLDPGRDALIFDYLNTIYWPFSYGHMRRFLDFQNRVFRQYALDHGLDFVEVADEYPRDPRLFGDAIHMIRSGIYLQAWIVFNQLVPMVERRLQSHEWPRPARLSPARHPVFGNRRLMPMSDVASCDGLAATTR